jgi:hypothetical protein
MSNADAQSLARLVYHAADAAASDSAIGQWMRNTMVTTSVEIAPVVPLRVRYDVVEIRRESLLLHRDVYGLAGAPSYAATLAVLQRAGIDTSRIDSASVALVVRRARRAPQYVALASLLRMP